MDYSLQFIGVSYKIKSVSGKKWWKVVRTCVYGRIQSHDRCKRQADHSLTIPGRIRTGIRDDKGTGWMPVCINKDARKFSRFFMAGAAPCEMDKQGRTLIPATLREFAKMKKEVVLTGMADRIEIWSKEKWIENNSYEDMDDIAASMQGLGLSI